MNFRAGAVLPVLLAVTPVSAAAQHQTAYFFDATPAGPPRVLEIAQDPPSDKPELVMGRSGIFLGIIGMIGGAVVGSAVSQSVCDEEDALPDCRSRYSFTGALVGGSIMVPVGVHIANKQPKSLGKSIGVSLLTGAAVYFGMRAIPGEPVQMAPFLAAPLQMITSVRIERPDASPETN